MTGKDAGEKKKTKQVANRVMDDDLHVGHAGLAGFMAPPKTVNPLWLATTSTTSGVHYADAPMGSQTYSASTLGM